MLAGLAVAMALNSLLSGEEPKAKDTATDGTATAKNGAAANNGSLPAPDPSVPKKKGRAAAGRDPVASAFALPRGLELTTAQQAAYDALKQQYEGQLRQAFDNVQQADDAATTGQALKEVRECRAKIRAGIKDILAIPYREAVQSASQSSSSGGSGESGGYVPQPGNNGNYYYPAGYYLGVYYPAGYYPRRWHDHYSTSSGTNNVAGTTSTPAKPQSTPKPPFNKPPPKPAAKPNPKSPGNLSNPKH